MTGLVTQLTAGAFTAGNILIPPLPTVPGGASTALWAYVGTDIGHSQNLMPSSPAMVNIGAPTYQPAYGTFTSSTIVIDTGLKDDNKTFSVIFAVRNGNTLTSPNISCPIGNNDPGTLFGVNIAYSASGLQSTTNASGISRTLAVSNVNTWKLFAIAYADATFTQDIFNLSDSTTDHFVGTGTRNLAATSNWWIGGNPRPLGNQPSDVAFAGLIKGQAISQAIAIQYAANIRANLAIRGLVVP